MEGMPQSPRHHKPVKFTTEKFENYEGGQDPATLQDAAYRSAHALLSQGRATHDDAVTERLVEFTDVFGLETIAQMWSHAAPISLPGALWRMYALRDTVQKHGAQISRYYERGMNADWTARVVSGVADPPTELEILNTADQILSGAYTSEFDIALERFAAFCRVVAAGEDATAAMIKPGTYSEATGMTTQRSDESAQPSAEVRTEATARASSLREHSTRLRGTAVELDTAAAKWRAGALDE